jgi:hypothetical protein
MHARNDLELLDGLERRAHLGSRARAQRIVTVVAAVHRDVVSLRGLARGDIVSLPIWLEGENCTPGSSATVAK